MLLLMMPPSLPAHKHQQRHKNVQIIDVIRHVPVNFIHNFNITVRGCGGEGVCSMKIRCSALRAYPSLQYLQLHDAQRPQPSRKTFGETLPGRRDAILYGFYLRENRSTQETEHRRTIRSDISHNILLKNCLSAGLNSGIFVREPNSAEDDHRFCFVKSTSCSNV